MFRIREASDVKRGKRRDSRRGGAEDVKYADSDDTTF
jgi:hypothetical protein